MSTKTIEYTAMISGGGTASVMWEHGSWRAVYTMPATNARVQSPALTSRDSAEQWLASERVVMMSDWRMVRAPLGPVVAPNRVAQAIAERRSR